MKVVHFDTDIGKMTARFRDGTAVKVMEDSYGDTQVLYASGGRIRAYRYWERAEYKKRLAERKAGPPLSFGEFQAALKEAYKPGVLRKALDTPCAFSEMGLGTVKWGGRQVDVPIPEKL